MLDLANPGNSTGDAAGDEFVGIENFVATDFDDLMVGDADDNDFSGAKGDDTLIGGEGGDTLDGGAGNDTASYVLATAGVILSLDGSRAAEGEALGDVFISIENLIGSGFGDGLIADGNDNTIEGLAGIDLLDGRGGDDNLLAGGDDDILIGGEGADTQDGGDGFDIAAYFNASAYVVVNLLDDSKNEGEAEGDVFSNIELYYGSAFGDTFSGTQAADFLFGGGGNDLLIGLGGDDLLDGGDGSDTFDGGAGADVMRGGDGNDTVSYASAMGSITLNLQSGTHTGDAAGDLFSSIENFIGSDYADAMVGDDAAQSFDSGLGNDYLVGLGGDDTLLAGAGEDIVVGGAGADSMDGGDGFDILAYWSAETAVKVDLISGENNLGEAEGDTITNFEVIFGSFFDDTILGGGSGDFFISLGGDDLLDGRGGNDYLEGGEGLDTLIGGSGDDIINGGVGADSSDGGEGFDTLYLYNSAAGVRVDLTAGTGVGGEAEGDSYASIEGVIGSNFDDVIIGDLPVELSALWETKGGITHAFYGFAGNDSLSGGLGDDVLSGGTGNDALVGGQGYDLAVFDGVRAGFFVTRGTDLEGKSAISVNGITLYTAQGSDIVGGVESFDFLDRTFNFAVDTVDDIDSASFGSTEAEGNVTDNDIGSTLILDAGDPLAPTVVGVIGSESSAYYVSNVWAPGLTVTGKYGTLEIEEDGAYTYTLDTNDADYQALINGETAVETFEYIVTPGDTAYFDLASVTSSGFLNITITGTNHAPVVNLDTNEPSRNGLNDGDFITAASSGLLGSGTVFIAGNPAGGGNPWTGDASTSQFDAPSNALVSDVDVSGLVPNYKSVTFSLSAVGPTVEHPAGDTSLDSFESIDLSDAAIDALGFLGYTLTQNTDSTITVTAPDDNLMTGNFLTSLVKAVTYQNNQSDFSLNVSDRKVLVTVTDAFNATDTAEATIAIRASVVNLTGNGSFTGGYLSDNIQGGTGNDTINGGAGNDTIAGSNLLSFSGFTYTGGTNTLNGGEGNDLFVGGFSGGSGKDAMDGGTGIDTVDYSASNAAVTVNLDTGLGSGGHAAGDTYANIENIIGSSKADTLTGSKLANEITGGGGNDTIAGLGGGDTLTGSAGSRDIATYAASAEGVTVNLGDSSLNAGGDAEGDVLASIEDLTGSDYNDSLTGDLNSNRLLGGEGNDSLSGAGNNDTLNGGNGNDLAFENVDGSVSISGSVTPGGGALFGAGLNSVLESIEAVELTGTGLNNTFTIADVNTSFTIDIIGGTGNDTVAIGSGYTQGVTFLLAETLDLPPYTDGELVRGVYNGSPLGGSLTLEASFSGIETVIGSAQDDFFAWDAKDGDYTVDGAAGNDILVAAYVPEVVFAMVDRPPPIGPEPRIVATFTLTSTAIDLVTSLEELPPPPVPPIEPLEFEAPIFVPVTTSLEYSNIESVIVAGFDGQIDVLDFSGAAEGGVGDTNGFITGFALDDSSAGGVEGLLVQSSDIDVLIGSGFDDTLYGDDLQETLVGGGGNDFLQGAANNDSLDGGADFDIADFDDTLANAQVSYTTDDDGFVTDFTQVISADGTDSLIRIEALMFNDGTLDLTRLVQLFDENEKLIGTFDTIQDAVNAAADTMTGANETIRVKAPEREVEPLGKSSAFAEQLIIDNAGGSLTGLSIIGVGTNEVRLVAPGTGLYQTGNNSGASVHAIITIQNFALGQSVSLENLTVDGTGLAKINPAEVASQGVGIYVRLADGVVLDDVTVENITGGGDILEPEVAAVEGQGIGILVDNQGSAGTFDFTLTDSTVTAFSLVGVYVLGTDMTVDGNTITGTGPNTEVRQAGILAGNGSSGEITGNTITGLDFNPSSPDGGSGFDLASDEVAIGIFIGDSAGGPTNLLVSGNTLIGGAEVTEGNALDEPGVAGFAGVGLLPWLAGSNITVTGNTITNAVFGVLEEPSAAFNGNTLDVEGNTFTDIGVYNYFLNSDPAVTNTISRTGTEGDDGMFGASGTDVLAGGEGNDIVIGGAGNDLLGGDDGDDTLEGGTGTDLLFGGDGNDTLTGGQGRDTLVGGDGNDTYYAADLFDVVSESLDGGVDVVETRSSYILSAHVENLTLLDGPQAVVTFEDYELGPIADGENGWYTLTPNRDQEVVDLGGNKAFRISSDPSSGDFAGPFSVPLTDLTGEITTSAAYSSQVISFDVKPFNGLDGSRIEVDIGNSQGTDRNNFMVLTADPTVGFRIAVNEPTSPDGEFGPFNTFPNDSRTLVQGLDPNVFHRVTLLVVYNPGTNNDTIEVYVDGEFVGSTSTFENYRDFATLEDPVASREGNLTNRLFFRAGNNGQVQDGPGGQNQGFVFDNLSGEDAFGVGNDLDNVITGNRGNNVLAGQAGADTLDGAAGSDTADYSESFDAVTVSLATGTGLGGDAEGDVLISIENLTGSAEGDVLIGDAGGNLLQGLDGDDLLEGGAGADRLLGGSGNDTATYESGLVAVTADLRFGGSDGDAEGDVYDSIENLIGTDFDDTLIGDAEGNSLFGGLGNDDLDGEGGADSLEGGAGNDSLIGGFGADTLTGGEDNDTLDGGEDNDQLQGGVGVDSLLGGQGNDILTGGADNDALDGGAGVDMAVYSDTPTITWTGSAWQVVSTADGTDSLTGIEGVDGNGPGGPITWLVGGGGFATIDEAIDAASDGDTILVGGGNYAGFTLDKALTIKGLNSNVDGAATRGTESSITSASFVTTTTGVAVLDGLDFRFTGPTPAAYVALTLSGASTLTIENSRFYSDVANGANAEFSRGLAITSAFTGTVTVDDNYFGGAQDGSANKYNSSNWNRGIYSDGNAAQLVITGNTFDNVRTGLNLDGYDNTKTFVGGGPGNGNVFTTSGTGISIGLPTSSAYTQIEGNTFSDVDTDFNLQNVTAFTVLFNLNTTNNIASDTLTFLSGAMSDTVTGTAFNDAIVADRLTSPLGSGSDTVFGLGGNDTIAGGAGNDTLDGGGDDDSIDGGTADDVLSGGTGNDTLTGGDANDSVTGGNDVLNGNEGADSLFGYWGNDVLDGGSGNDTLDGGEGTDTVEYGFGGTLGVTVNLLLGTATDNFGNTDSLISIENVNGTSLRDAITGSNGANTIYGGLGTDTMAGGEINIPGGNGADTFFWANTTEITPLGSDLGFAAADSIADFTVVDDTLLFGTDFQAAFISGVAVLVATDLTSSGGYAGGSSGQATFIFDATNSTESPLGIGSNGALFYDAAGDGQVDARIVTFGFNSDLGNFNQLGGFSSADIQLFGFAA